MPELGSNWNTSYAMPTTVTSFDSGLIIFLILLIVGAIILILLVTSIDRYTRFFKALQWVKNSLRYAAFGTGISAVFYGLYLVCSFLVSAGSGIDPMIFVLIIGGYIAMSLIGYAGIWIKNKVQNMHDLYKRNKGDIKGEITCET